MREIFFDEKLGETRRNSEGVRVVGAVGGVRAVGAVGGTRRNSEGVGGVNN